MPGCDVKCISYGRSPSRYMFGSHCPVLAALALLCDFVNGETDEAGEAERENTHALTQIAKGCGLCSRVKGFTEHEFGEPCVQVSCRKEESGGSVGTGRPGVWCLSSE